MVPEHDHGPVLGPQGVNGAVEQSGHLPTAHGLLGRVAPEVGQAIQRVDLVAVFVHTGRRQQQSALPQVIDSGVVGNAKQPARKPEARVVLVQPPEHLEEGILGQILGKPGILHQSGDQVVDGPLETPHQRRARLTGSCAGSDGQIVVAERLQ